MVMNKKRNKKTNKNRRRKATVAAEGGVPGHKLTMQLYDADELRATLNNLWGRGGDLHISQNVLTAAGGALSGLAELDQVVLSDADPFARYAARRFIAAGRLLSMCRWHLDQVDGGKAVCLDYGVRELRDMESRLRVDGNTYIFGTTTLPQEDMPSMTYIILDGADMPGTFTLIDGFGLLQSVLSFEGDS